MTIQLTLPLRAIDADRKGTALQRRWIVGCRSLDGIDTWRRGETVVMVRVTKRSDRRPASLAVYKRLASTACWQCLIRLVYLTSLYAQTLDPHARLHLLWIVRYRESLNSEALSKPSRVGRAYHAHRLGRMLDWIGFSIMGVSERSHKTNLTRQLQRRVYINVIDTSTPQLSNCRS